MEPSRMLRPLLLSLTVLLAGFTSVMLWATQGEPLKPQAFSGLMPASGKADIGGTFALIDQNGKKVSDADFRGKLMLVFFGFTHCPDICPVAMQTMTDMMNMLKNQGTQVVPVFITVDPARDTPQRMKEYLANFHSSIVGLTGTVPQIEAAAKAYKAFYSTPQAEEGAHEHAHEESPAVEGGSYMVNHSGLMYLMDRNGIYLTHFPQDAAPETLAKAIRAELRR